LPIEEPSILDAEEINLWLSKFQEATDQQVKKQVKNVIILAFLPLVKKIAHGLARRNTDPIEDIIQVGSLGLIKAVEQYNKKHGASFKTYATYLITGEIRHYLRDKIAMIRAPRELQELSIRLNNITEKLKTKLERLPTEIEIAEELQMPLNKINEVFEVDRRKQVVSLDQLAFNNSESEQSLVDQLIDNKYLSFQRLQEERLMLHDAVQALPEQLQEIIELSFFQDLNQNEIAQKIGISQMQVSRRIKKATTELFKIISVQKNSKNKG